MIFLGGYLYAHPTHQSTVCYRFRLSSDFWKPWHDSTHREFKRWHRHGHWSTYIKYSNCRCLVQICSDPEKEVEVRTKFQILTVFVWCNITTLHTPSRRLHIVGSLLECFPATQPNSHTHTHTHTHTRPQTKYHHQGKTCQPVSLLQVKYLSNGIRAKLGIRFKQ